jgi:putative membrane protein
MNALIQRLPYLTYALLTVFLLLCVARGQSETTVLLIASSVLMFACCWTSAIQLLGGRAALHFVLIAVTAGWFAEQMGASHGWFFGDYDYTNVLGPALGDVPVIIPLMWFALTYVAYVIANFIVWHTPVDGVAPLGQTAVMSLLAALIVTAYDLGADPYMVFTLKAWIMVMKDGWWFGETLQGFFGWAFVAFFILFCFRLTLRRFGPRPATAVAKWHTLAPMGIYGGSMVFQMIYGSPVETRTIAFFAMGIPLLCALLGWWRWRRAGGAAGALA